MTSESENIIDYNGLMQAHLARVFNEPDSARRLAAITEIYADDANLYEPPNASADLVTADDDLGDPLPRAPRPGINFRARVASSG